MPSTATITTYYTFVAGQKARAAQVNANFSLYRGHIFPIDPNTATGINNTYDNGSADYRWRRNYQYSSYYPSATSTADAVIEADTASTAGALNFKMNGVTEARIDSDGLDLSYGKNSSLPFLARASRSGFTTAAGIGQIARSSTINGSAVTTGSYVVTLVGSTITIQTNGGILCVLVEGNVSATFNLNTTTSKSVYIGAIAGGENVILQRGGLPPIATWTAYDRWTISHEGSRMRLFALSAGTHEIVGRFSMNGGGDSATAGGNVQITAWEL